MPYSASLAVGWAKTMPDSSWGKGTQVQVLHSAVDGSGDLVSVVMRVRAVVGVRALPQDRRALAAREYRPRLAARFRRG